MKSSKDPLARNDRDLEPLLTFIIALLATATSDIGLRHYLRSCISLLILFELGEGFRPLRPNERDSAPSVPRKTSERMYSWPASLIFIEFTNFRKIPTS
jgi:hypothetical protein